MGSWAPELRVTPPQRLTLVLVPRRLPLPSGAGRAWRWGLCRTRASQRGGQVYWSLRGSGY